MGPFQAKFVLVGIDDIRAIKKKIIVDRAKRIVQEWATKTISEGEEMLKDVYDASKPGNSRHLGKHSWLVAQAFLILIGLFWLKEEQMS